MLALAATDLGAPLGKITFHNNTGYRIDWHRNPLCFCPCLMLFDIYAVKVFVSGGGGQGRWISAVTFSLQIAREGQLQGNFPTWLNSQPGSILHIPVERLPVHMALIWSLLYQECCFLSTVRRWGKWISRMLALPRCNENASSIFLPKAPESLLIIVIERIKILRLIHDLKENKQKNNAGAKISARSWIEFHAGTKTTGLPCRGNKAGIVLAVWWPGAAFTCCSVQSPLIAPTFNSWAQNKNMAMLSSPKKKWSSPVIWMKSEN